MNHCTYTIEVWFSKISGTDLQVLFESLVWLMLFRIVFWEMV
jgi:hypothetical protein